MHQILQCMCMVLFGLLYSVICHKSPLTTGEWVMCRMYLTPYCCKSLDKTPGKPIIWENHLCGKLPRHCLLKIILRGPRGPQHTVGTQEPWEGTESQKDKPSLTHRSLKKKISPRIWAMPSKTMSCLQISGVTGPSVGVGPVPVSVSASGEGPGEWRDTWI